VISKSQDKKISWFFPGIHMLEIPSIPAIFSHAALDTGHQNQIPPSAMKYWLANLVHHAFAKWTFSVSSPKTQAKSGPFVRQ
jgi:hypothetical protein